MKEKKRTRICIEKREFGLFWENSKRKFEKNNISSADKIFMAIMVSKKQ